MAGVNISIQTAKIATGNSAKTLLQLVAAAQQRVKVKEISISFDGVSNTGVPILVEVVRQTSAGTMSAQTIRKWNNSDGETLQTTAQNTATAEPTDSGDVPVAEQVHPQQGFLWQARYADELIAKGGERLGIRVTAAVGVNAVVR